VLRRPGGPALGGRVPRRRCAAPTFFQATGVRPFARFFIRIDRTCGGRGLPRLLAAIFARRPGSRCLARRLACALGERTVRGASDRSKADVPAVARPTPSAWRHFDTVCGVTPHQWQTARLLSRRTARARPA
jgi:hypothetical protein